MSMVTEFFESAQLALEISKDLLVALKGATPWNKFPRIFLVADGTDDSIHEPVGALAQVFDFYEG